MFHLLQIPSCFKSFSKTFRDLILHADIPKQKVGVRTFCTACEPFDKTLVSASISVFMKKIIELRSSSRDLERQISIRCIDPTLCNEIVKERVTCDVIQNSLIIHISNHLFRNIEFPCTFTRSLMEI